MAKKKIEIPLRSGSDVPSGDVNISYKGSRIAGLSESSAAVLKTENTIVRDDIEVEYTKAAGQSIGNAVTFTNNTASERTVESTNRDGNACIIVDNQIGYLNAESNTTVNGIVLSYLKSDGKYYNVLSVGSSSDSLNVSVNDTPISFSPGDFGSGFYRFETPPSDEPIVGETYTVVASDKQGE